MKYLEGIEETWWGRTYTIGFMFALFNIYNKIYKYMTSVSNNVYINKLDDIVNKYNNTYHSTIKMKSIDVKSIIYFYFNKKMIRKVPLDRYD